MSQSSISRDGPPRRACHLLSPAATFSARTNAAADFSVQTTAAADFSVQTTAAATFSTRTATATALQERGGGVLGDGGGLVAAFMRATALPLQIPTGGAAMVGPGGTVPTAGSGCRGSRRRH